MAVLPSFFVRRHSVAENNLKKTLLFSSLEKKELVDNIVSDESNSIGRKISAIIELTVMDELLTKNNQIRFWITELYKGCTSGEILSSIFDYNSAGFNWKSRGLPLLPLIEFAIDEQKFMEKYEVDKEPITHLIKCLNSIHEIFDSLNKDDEQHSLKYTEALDAINCFIEQLSDEKEKIHFAPFYRFFKTLWNDLKDSMYTFEALSDLASMQKGWRNTSESRYTLTKCLRDLADNWSNELE